VPVSALTVWSIRTVADEAGTSAPLSTLVSGATDCTK
jgi:hypothetical protein